MKQANHHFATSRDALTLVELLVVIAVISLLVALVFPVTSDLGNARSHARRIACISNLQQINLAIHVYLDDQNNGSPGNTNSARSPFLSWIDYRELIKSYVGIKSDPSSQDRVFACPSDKFFYDLSKNGRGYVPEPMHDQTNHAFTSYAYNAGQFTTPVITRPPPAEDSPATTNYYGIAGLRLDTVPYPGTTVLIAETPAFAPYSWHDPKRPFSPENSKFNDARDNIGFVDGHVSYLKIYYDGKKIAWSYNPPAGYSYQWSAD